ncbi:hypothetical protein BaRGS_00025977 [Batillaria attramentaria]|uniref:Uncharacterized protein n=1 Tax=Batillaria attramentaria TaxID=370345 RepID=A0ABD0K640_9CAEN
MRNGKTDSQGGDKHLDVCPSITACLPAESLIYCRWSSTEKNKRPLSPLGRSTESRKALDKTEAWSAFGLLVFLWRPPDGDSTTGEMAGCQVLCRKTSFSIVLLGSQFSPAMR